MAHIEVRGIHKSFGSLKVLKGVDLTVQPNEVVTLIGPSGSGKSTLLRCLNLLEIPDDGEFLWEGEEVPYKTLDPVVLSSHRRRTGMVFQHFNLFGHMNVLQNVMEGPTQVLGLPPEQAQVRAVKLLDRVGLSDKQEAWPSQLSGGQKQRVAIARALAMEPQALLLDEVTSALDVEMIAGINQLLAELASEMTMVIVTHDLLFARQVAHRIVFFDGGRVIEHAPPQKLLDEPQHERTKKFLDAVPH